MNSTESLNIFQFAEKLFPDYSPECVEDIVWEHTSYPFSTQEICEGELKEFAKKLFK